MKKPIVKNTIGPYSVVCVEVAKILPEKLIDWIKSHGQPTRTMLTEHVILCHRCSEVHKASLRAMPPISPEELQEFQSMFDPAVCTEVANHRKDLVDWLYSIRGTRLFYEAQNHLGLCNRCPATMEEVGEILDIPD